MTMTSSTTMASSTVATLPIDAPLESKLVDLCHRLIDQHRAKVLIRPHASSDGYWFGGGNLAAGPDGELYLVGRYRNRGDSRTGLAEGTRGRELAVFRFGPQGDSVDKILSFDKRDLSLPGREVLSIEGSAIRFGKERFSKEGLVEDTVELYVSTEKDGVGYPSEFREYLKPGTGVWSIDRLRAKTISELEHATIESVLVSEDPATIHVKDPFLYETHGERILCFCSHPFSWTCSNTGYTKLDGQVVFDFFPRGNVWDVAMSRGTSIVDVPQVGAFAGLKVQLMFYDGGECVRDHRQHAQSVERPRGHSCEELGGAAYFVDGQFHASRRLSRYGPLFVSPHGTGCNRYVDILSRPEGMYATWQQAQADGSQPLVFHFVSRAEIEHVLS